MTGLRLNKVVVIGYLVLCAALIVAGNPRTIHYVGVSLEHQENGVNAVRAIACLGGLIGAVDRVGADPWPESLGERSLTLYDERPLADQQPVGAADYPVLYDFYTFGSS